MIPLVTRGRSASRALRASSLSTRIQTSSSCNPMMKCFSSQSNNTTSRLGTKKSSPANKTQTAADLIKKTGGSSSSSKTGKTNNPLATGKYLEGSALAETRRLIGVVERIVGLASQRPQISRRERLQLARVPLFNTKVLLLSFIT